MAQRARHAVGRQSIRRTRPLANRQVGEDLRRQRPGPARAVARHRHVADGALVLDRGRLRRMIESSRGGPRPASTGRATSSPSSTRASARRSRRPRQPAWSGRCGRPGSCRRSGKGPRRRGRRPGGCGGRRGRPLRPSTMAAQSERQPDEQMARWTATASHRRGPRRTSPTAGRSELARPARRAR